ncbi:MAG: DUF87 domain-containing protein [Deferribacteres bacterium]|nr:DUF87 domain-containing protein [candidate division KSB1 bacterium]MCB9501391.1 DUF87 domain-containing protein [Deferribacteres bacterium]
MSWNSIKFIQFLFGRRLRKETRKVLADLGNAEGKMHKALEYKLNALNKNREALFDIGTTEWGFPVSVPLSSLLKHALIIGSSGSGKSYTALLMISDSLNKFFKGQHVPFGILDGKGELAPKVLEYIQAYGYKMGDKEREQFKKKIYVMDFSESKAITPYNLLDSQHLSPEMVVSSRMQSFEQIFHGSSQVISTRMQTLLKYMLFLLIEFKLPITLFEQLCLDPATVKRLANKSKNERLRHYFTHRFPRESRATILGLAQRIDSLFVSDGVRLSMSAKSAPDFQKLMDEGCFIIINVCGPTISRSTSEFLLRVILSDIQQSVFRRKKRESKYLWFLDEAQVLYRDPRSRENMNDLLTMARSFGSFFIFLTQAITSAVRDTRILNSLMQNLGWVTVFQSIVHEAKLLSSALPLTGNMTVGKSSLYEQPHYLTKEQELKVKLEEIAHFPSQIAYFWLKSHLPQAVKIKTRDLDRPEVIAGCSRSAFEQFMQQHPFENLIPQDKIEKELQDAKRVIDACKPEKVESGTSIGQDKESREDVLMLLEKDYVQKKKIRHSS